MMGGFYRWNRVTVKRAPVMSAEKILEALAVDAETPLLLAVLAVLAGLEEMEKEAVGGMRLSAEERAVTAGRLAALGDAQERILELAEEGRKRKK